MKVKYNGDSPIRHQKMDWMPGEEKELHESMVFDEVTFKTSKVSKVVDAVKKTVKTKKKAE